jgi:hypothetical protein
MTEELERMKRRWEASLEDKRQKVTEADVATTVSMMTGIPVSKMASAEGIRMKGMREELKSNVIAQDSAVDKLVNAIQRSRVGLNDPNRPIGTFMFLGPTGVGKTYLAKNPHVKAAQGEEDLGVVVSWNTEGPENKGRASLVVAPGAVAINPLNWKTDETPAPADLNLGSFAPHLLTHGLHRLHVKADAVLDTERGTVIVTEPRLKKYVITAIPGLEKFESVFGPASYHGCDYSFFYLNIRENARKRMEAWFAAHPLA